MLVIVARSSTDSDSTASPQYSTSFPIARPLFTYGWRRISSMKSFAVTLSGFRPRTTILTVSGTVSRTSRVIHELKMAVVPTPNATHPTAPACGVCESLPMMTMPGSACPSRIFEWDRLRAVSRESQLAVQADALFLGELALLLLQLQRHVQQPFLDALRRHRLAQEREVVAEHEDRARIVDLLVRPHELLEEDRRHRGDVLVAEPDIGDHKPLVAGPHRRNADLALGRIDDPVPRDDLFAERHWSRRRPGRREGDLTLQPRHVEVEKPAVLDDSPRDLPFARREGVERDRFAAPHPVED